MEINDLRNMTCSLTRIFAIVFVGLLLVASGCVSASKYKALQAQLDETVAEKEQLNTQVETLNLKVDKQKKIHSMEVARREGLEQVKEDMIRKLKKELNKKQVKIGMLEGQLKVEFVEQLFFDSGSATLKPAGRKALARIAPILKSTKGHTIRIIGHADGLPPGPELKKKYPSNWELSAARATSVVQVLQWGYKIDPSRMVAGGVAHYQPLPGENEEGVRTANRAVEILLVPLRY